jgi:methylenetetrahydrofolate reductase (NADPH)
MHFIRDLYSAATAEGRPLLSIEFFTPKTPEGDRSLFERTLPALAALRPGYCSVTYGAGGSTRDKTLDMVARIQRDHGIAAMAHLTCVGSTRDEIAALLEDARRRGIVNLLALRGDPPAGTTTFQQVAGGFQYAHELVTLTRRIGGFCVGVAGFPEGHLECREGRLVDWERLKMKVDCGADFILTQLFFDNACFYEFRDHLAKRLGVRVPIVPGVIPIQSASQIRKFVSLCGATIPATLSARLDALADDDAAAAEYGIEFATAQCADLLRHGVPGLHFYSLNKAAAVTRIVEALGLGAQGGPSTR